MNKTAVVRHPSTVSRFDSLFPLKKTGSQRLPSRIEPLEERYAPATFTGAGGASLNIVLDQVGEALSILSNGGNYEITSNFLAQDGGNTNGGVTGFNTFTAVVDADAYSAIYFTDAATGTAISFAGGTFTTDLTILLDDPSAGALTFGGVTALNGGLTASVTGGITQTAAISATQPVSFTSTAGAIDLSNAANNFSTLSLHTSGANAINARSSATLTLDEVTTETGDLTITTGSGVAQTSTGRLVVGGTTTFDVTGGASVGLLLAGAANFFGGPVIITESGGDIGEVRLRNVSPTAALPILSDLTAADIGTLTLIFDGTGIAMDAATETVVTAGGTLNLTAGGSITQTAPITLGTLNVTALGNNGITLNDPANNVNSVSLNNRDADGGEASAVAFTNADSFTIDESNLGLGTAAFTALTGDIDQDGGIVQRLGAGQVTFTLSTGTNLQINDSNNLFAGAVRIVGANIDSVQITDRNTLAAVPDISDIADTLTELEMEFLNAPIVLPSYTLVDLEVEANGIFQLPDTALLVSGNAHFNSNAFGITLTNPTNDFTTLSLNSSGRMDVSVVDVDDVAFGAGNSTLGLGRLTVTAGGAVTQNGNRITQLNGAGPASFTAASISLTQAANNFTGELLLDTPGAATVVDSNSSLVTGLINVGGALTLTASQSITQLPGSTITVAGASTFDSGGGVNVITLDNFRNAMTGSITVRDGNVTLRNSVGVNFAGASTAGSLRVTANGTIGQAGGSALVVSGATSLDAGTNAILLNEAGNNFQAAVSLASTAAVTIRDLDAFQFGNVKLGAGALSVTAAGTITQLSGTAITQSGPGALSLLGGFGNNVSLNQNNNDLLGAITVDANNVTMVSLHDVLFAAGADIDGNLIVTAGGTLTLPTNAANLNDLNTISLSAARTIVGSGLGADTGSGITFLGTVDFAPNITITTTGNRSVTFNGDVNAGGALTFNVGTAKVTLARGTWDQGANPLTVTSTGDAALQIGDGIPGLATLVASGGSSLDLNVAPGEIALSVLSDGTFGVGTLDGTAETVTIDSGTNGFVRFDPGATLQVGFGATNDRLVINGTGETSLEGARLLGIGAVGVTPSDVLQVTGGGFISGEFANSRDAAGVLQPFLAGSDIVLAAYLPTGASVGQGGIASTNGVVTGYLPDGDKYTVSHSAKGNAGLVVIENGNGGIDIAVRNNAGGGTLSITTTRYSGDGFTEVGGIGVNGSGAITISAASVNLVGDVRVQGSLKALTIRDVIAQPGAHSIVIQDGAIASNLTTITGHVFDGVAIELGGVLNKLTLAQFLQTDPKVHPSSITAERFGTIAINGDAKAFLPGEFSAVLTNTNTLNSAQAALSSAKIARNLSGAWDLEGSIGKVTAKSTSDWALGSFGANAQNPHGVTSITSLSLGAVASTFVNATETISTLTATNWNFGSVQAGAIGTLSVTGDSAAGFFGHLDSVGITVTGNTNGTAIKTLSIAGTLAASVINLRDGNLVTLKVGRDVIDSSIAAIDTATGGRINTITVGRWATTNIDAESIGTFSAVGNAPAGLFGDIIDSDFTLRGASAGAGLGKLTASGEFDSNQVIVQTGNLTTFSVAREVSNSTIALYDSDALGGTLKSFTAGRVDGTTLIAKTISSIKVTGAPQTGPASPLLVGDFASSNVLAYFDNGKTAAIGTVKIAGELASSTLVARNGMTSLIVARSIDSTTILADNVADGQLTVGRIGTLTAGDFIAVNLTARTIGKLSTTGFTQLEGDPVKELGHVSGSNILVPGAAPAGTKSGIDSFTVAGAFTDTTLIVPAGIPAVTVKLDVSDSTIALDNPLDLATGKLGKFNAAGWLDTILRANSIGTLQTIGSPTTFILGSFDNSDLDLPAITVGASTTSATDPLAITTFSVAGDLIETSVNVPGGIKTFAVLGTVSDSDLAAGFASTAKLTTLTTGAWENSDLTTRALTTWNVPGNTIRGFAGDVSDSLVTIMGNVNNVGLGKFTAQGIVSNSTFQITDGNVSSFIVGKFLSSDLFAGFRPDSTIDLSQAGTFALSDRVISLFKTTQPFDSADPDSISFADSNVVAADLGAITLLGVGAVADRPTIFGIGFEIGGTAGTVKADTGSGLAAVTAPTDFGSFTFRAL